ncbi:uncharacterized protein [Bactrocera oleae]|uniref:uncharacterized protein isoform X2 n=1 Tax=Bactrocera oleae TaxID=104688 RepID=UPI00387E8F58
MQDRNAYECHSSKSERHTVVYTDENVPVYKLTIVKLPKNLKSVRIKQHFSKFGQIINVEILYGKTRSIPAQCIIHYQNAKDAGAALKQKYHTINHQRVRVQPCPSWEQPYLMEHLFKSNNNVNLLMLNDYCLEMIFQHLDLRQQLRLSLCHPRLENIFTYMICPRLQRNCYLEVLLQFSTWELRQFLKTAGIYMERFVIAKEYPSFRSRMSICALLQECGLRINSLHLIAWMPWQYSAFLVSLQLSAINELELYNCNLTDIDLQCLLKLRNLKVLGLAGNYHIQGTHLKYFRNLERLSLCGCEEITNDALSQCCRHLQLSFLDIRLGNSILTETVVELCKTLDTLKLTRFTETIAKLPKLRSLEVHHTNSSITTSFYNALVEYHADNLLELKLTGETYLMLPTVARIVRLHKLRTLWLGDHIYNGSKQVVQLVTKLSDLEEISLQYSLRIRDQHLLPLIIKCTKLKRINLRMCRYITTNFIWSTLEILSQRVTAAQPLIILVYGTCINADILRVITKTAIY